MFTMEVITISTFGEKLKSYRLAAGLTQEELANKCGMKKQSISRYEKSEREPNIRIASVLARELGISLESLVNGSVPDGVDMEALAGEDLSAKQKEFIRLLDRLSDQEISMLLSQIKGLLRDR